MECTSLLVLGGEAAGKVEAQPPRGPARFACGQKQSFWTPESSKDVECLECAAAEPLARGEAAGE